MDDLLAIWKTRRKVIATLDWPACSAVLYQLDKCILDLEMELKYERELKPRSASAASAVLVESRNSGK